MPMNNDQTERRWSTVDAGRASASFARQDSRQPKASQGTGASMLQELTAARARVQALESRPRARCRVSQVLTSPGLLITAADEMLALMLHRPVRPLIGMTLSMLIAGPDRKLTADRAKSLLESADGVEWETRIVAPGALVGVPVAITAERGRDGGVAWYFRDLTELRRAQARVMQLEMTALEQSTTAR